MRNEDSIAAAKQGFEASFEEAQYYNKQTQDEKHLLAILEAIDVKPGMKILDLGCGSGYLTFPIAQKNERADVIGLDIVANTLKSNNEKREQQELTNLEFVAYDGIVYPFENNTFDLVVTRYALHHFPQIKNSMREIARVLKQGGRLFISDPRPNACDTSGFVNDYMQLKKDGHIKFYAMDEWVSICKDCGLRLTAAFDSSIRFPKKKDTAHGYEEVLARHDKSIIDSYELTETDEEIWITEQVNNLTFEKDFLLETKCIDHSHPAIMKKADELRKQSSDTIDYIKNAYEFVRDEISHSWDVQTTTVSRCASEVLQNGTGICWTKSCLLAALLRANGVPAGICYQKLTRADEDDSDGYIIHALNMVYIEEQNRWIRVDARGNKENVNAQFSLEEEQLAFPVRKELHEVDYHKTHFDLDERLSQILEESENILMVRTDFDINK